VALLLLELQKSENCLFMLHYERVPAFAQPKRTLFAHRIEKNYCGY
jgi:hypothetical protein